MKVPRKMTDLVKYQYSWILVPIFFILYILIPSYRIYLQYPLFCIGIIGISVGIYIKLPPKLSLLNISSNPSKSL